MVILTWKCLLSGLMLCDSHTMESPWAPSPKTYKPMSSFVRPRSAPALSTWLKFQPGRRGFDVGAGIRTRNWAKAFSWETLELNWRRGGASPGTVHRQRTRGELKLKLKASFLSDLPLERKSNTSAMCWVGRFVVSDLRVCLCVSPTGKPHIKHL